MLKNYFCAAMLFASCLSVTAPVVGQSSETSVKAANTAKPFKILTSGKKITIQSKHKISSIIVWTAGGHRIVEQKQINTENWTFEVNQRDNYFFLRLDLENGKVYTEKFGVK